MSEFNPYRPPTATLKDAPTEVSEMELAGRGMRLGAIIIDTIIYAIAIVPFMLIGLSATGNDNSMFIGMLIGVLIILGINLVMLYQTGQTIGKRLLKIKIVRTNGERAGLARIFFLRMFLPGLIGNIPFVGIVFTLADPLFIFQESRKCIHDLMADTIVINC